MIIVSVFKVVSELKVILGQEGFDKIDVTLKNLKIIVVVLLKNVPDNLLKRFILLTHNIGFLVFVSVLLNGSKISVLKI